MGLYTYQPGEIFPTGFLVKPFEELGLLGTAILGVDAMAVSWLGIWLDPTKDASKQNVQTPLKPNMAMEHPHVQQAFTSSNGITPALKIGGFSQLPFNGTRHRLFQVLGGCKSNIFVDVQPYTWEK